MAATKTPTTTVESNEPTAAQARQARQAAISKIVGSTMTSHNKPQGLVRVKAGEYSLEITKGKGNAAKVESHSITRNVSGAWTVDGQGEYASRGDAFVAAHSL